MIENSIPESPLEQSSPKKEQDFVELKNKFLIWKKRHPRRFLLVVLLAFLFFITLFSGLLLAFSGSNSTEENDTVLTATPTPTEASPTSTLVPTSTVMPTLRMTNTPRPITPTLATQPTTAAVSSSPTTQPTNGPTNTPAPTAAPPRTANPPQMSISYPAENQSIEMGPGQTFCVPDVPAGGDTSGLQRRQNTNGSWTGYAPHTTLCYEPQEGANTLILQYKNQYGEESPEYTKHFNFHRNP